ncbi:hypothetical protein KBX18_05265 [Corynebacterium sp. CCUG 69979]|uniref:hypothetical protein n=1 Tax=Corynebacterium sp. CCUG 69979 TaxID=2823890 RepID=UPI00210C22F3|nr:hypothetical protein [Corynebacterium sp. CCUG 69979]MCQ4624972.1 hypothetical protein [Corynebacterium sp. CCUG 69979]
MTNPNDPNNPFGGQDNNPFGGGYGNNSSNSNNQNPADSTGSTSYGQGGYGQSGQNGYGQSGSSSYGQGGSSAYGQTGADQTGSTPNSGYGDSTFGQSGQNGYGYGYDQGGSGYGAYGQTPGQDGYGQNSYGQAYAPGPGFQHPENDPNASESGRLLQPAGGPLPVVEPIPFAFKRLFTKNWHVYIGFTAVALIAMFVLMMLFMIPLFAQMAEDPYVDPVEENPIGLILVYVPILLISFLMSIVLYKVALRDTRGEEPSWRTLFKNIPWGQAILVNIIIGLVAGAAVALLVLLTVLLGFIHPALMAIGFILMFVAIFAAMPFLGMAPLYAYDGRTTAGGALKMAWEDVKPNFWPILGSMILISLICAAIGGFTLGVGYFVAFPLQMIAYVFIYRWISAHRDQPAGPQHPESPSGYMSMY